MTKFKTLFAAAAFLGAFGLPALASATTPEGYETASVRVAVADLNLDTDAGVKTYLKRIDRAASRACGGRPRVQSGMEGVLRHYRDCHSSAMEMAVAQVDSTLVAVRFAERQGRTYALASR